MHINVLMIELDNLNSRQVTRVVIRLVDAKVRSADLPNHLHLQRFAQSCFEGVET